MNRNQKIALGCGGAGCLGLIVVAIAGGLIYFFTSRAVANRNYNFNVSTNRNSNSNDNSDFTTNRNSNLSNSSNSSNSRGSSSSLSEDEKHRLYHCAGVTGDGELIRRVSVKIGLTDEDFTPSDDSQKFMEEHASWILRNIDFINSMDAEKARAYINAHMPD
jgi:hypothetical protein